MNFYDTSLYNKHGIFHFISYRVTSPNFQMMIYFCLLNSEDPDEMIYYAAFHPDFHCLTKYRFMGIQHKKKVNLQK